MGGTDWVSCRLGSVNCNRKVRWDLIGNDLTRLTNGTDGTLVRSGAGNNGLNPGYTWMYGPRRNLQPHEFGG